MFKKSFFLAVALIVVTGIAFFSARAEESDNYVNKIISPQGIFGYHFVKEDGFKYTIPLDGSAYSNAVLASWGLRADTVEQEAITLPITKFESYATKGNLTIKQGSNYLLKITIRDTLYIVDHDNYIRAVNKNDYLNYTVVVVPDSFFTNYDIISEDIPGGPDLVITDLQITDQNGNLLNRNLQRGEKVSLGPVYSNQGTVAVDNSLTKPISITNSVSSASNGTIYDYFNLGAGETRTINIKTGNNPFAYTFTESGSYDIKVIIDSDNKFTESNENNNTFTKTITVGGVTTEPKHVELFIKDIIAGDGGVKVIYGNLGPDTINGDFAITLAEINGKPLYQGETVLRSEVPEGETIGSGEITSTFFAIGTGQGTYEIVVTLDADNSIAEGDENNNKLRRYMTVGNNNSITLSQTPGSNLRVTNYHLQTIPMLPSGYNEYVIVDASKHTIKTPAQTRNKYSGIVEVEMDGMIQASGTSLSDAYYILTDYSGKTVTPIKANEFGLYVNGRRVQDFYPQGYVQGSQYYFKLALGDTPKAITFAIGDLYTSDNAGAFKIAVKGRTELVLCTN